MHSGWLQARAGACQRLLAHVRVPALLHRKDIVLADGQEEAGLLKLEALDAVGVKEPLLQVLADADLLCIQELELVVVPKFKKQPLSNKAGRLGGRVRCECQSEEWATAGGAATGLLKCRASTWWP